MTRILLLICLVCAVLVLASVAVSAVSRAMRDGQRLARDVATSPRTDVGRASGAQGEWMERISYTALILLMLGVTSGLLGGL